MLLQTDKRKIAVRLPEIIYEYVYGHRYRLYGTVYLLARLRSIVSHCQYSYIMTNSQSPWYLSCNPSDVMACMASSYVDIHQ